MSKIAVVYWSSTGNTEEMAKAVAQGARGAGAGCDLLICNQMDAAKAKQLLYLPEDTITMNQGISGLPLFRQEFLRRLG